MADIEPTGPGDSGVSVWVVVAVVVGVISLIAVAAFLIFQSLTGSGDTTLPAALDTTTTISESVTTTAQPATTTTAVSTTTTQSASESNPFVGWWKAVDIDGSLIDLRIDDEGGFFYWDSASGVCQNNNVRSPETWTGTTTVDMAVRPTLTATGTKQCYFYGVENPPATPREFDYYYDADTDTLEFAPDGVRYTRSSDVPGLPAEESNPFVGSWEATDGDGTRVTMTIQPDGAWNSVDTRSGGCERKGFTYATWSAEGTGTFQLAGPTFNLTMTTFCNPPDGSQIVHSPDVVWTFVHDQPSDSILLIESNGTTYTRLP